MVPKALLPSRSFCELIVEIREDTWLSGILGHGVFKLDLAAPDASQEADSVDFRSLIYRHARKQTAAMYYAKVDTAGVELVRQLSLAGLYVVDVNVTLGIDTQRLVDLPKVDGIIVSEMRSEYSQEVPAIQRAATWRIRLAGRKR